MLSPLLERFSLLLGIGMLLVDADDAGARPRRMPEERLDDLEPDAEPLHPGSDGSPQVMDAPIGEAYRVGIVAATPSTLLGTLEHEQVDVLLGATSPRWA